MKRLTLCYVAERTNRGFEKVGPHWDAYEVIALGVTGDSSGARRTRRGQLN